MNQAQSTVSFYDKELYQFLPSILEVTTTLLNKAARIVTWSIILLFLSAILWCCYGKVDIVVVGEGRLVAAKPSTKTVLTQSDIYKVGGYDVSSLEALVMFENKDIGFLKTGLPVELKVNAFRFTKYGLIEGELVALDYVENSQGLFRGRFKLTRNNVRVKGQPVTLKAGMSVVAEVNIGQRRIIDFILSPVQKILLESAKEE